MSGDAPVNSGAVKWPHPDSAYFTVRSMQIKLHRWAGENSSRRFGDLFNLVYDPAFLVQAWERVSGNKGARTPGVDKATVAMIETWVGVEEFLGQIRDSLKSGGFRPVEVRQVTIPNPDLSSGLMAGAEGRLAPFAVTILASGYDNGPAAGPGGRGFHRPRGSPSWIAVTVCAGQGACGSASMRCHAAVIASAHGQVAWIFRRRFRPPRTSRPAACSTR